MRKTFIMLLAVLTAAVGMAKPVDPVKARRVAEAFLQAQGMHNTAALVDVTSQTPFTEFYVFAAEEGGFVLVSGDDCVVPVLGYSVTNRFETKDIPEHVLWWLQGYEKEIRRVRSAEFGRGVPPCTPVVSREWAHLEAGEEPEPQLEPEVSPLMTTTWNQSPYYNNLCPYHSSSYSRSVTGCVATATAQVMKYHNYPNQGYGNHTYTSESNEGGYYYTFSDLTADFGNTTYQWSSMPNSLSWSSSSTEVNAVATLMYHVGVADEMRYSPVASGARNYNYEGSIEASSQTSLMRYFKYRSDMTPLMRADYSDSVFAVMLRAELDQSRPILYSGSNVSSGHSFVVDGYDYNGKFHFNWGWGGYCDGYFVIGSLNPGVGGIGGNSSGTYNMDNVALVGIQPNHAWDPSGTTTVTATGTDGGTVTGGGSYAFNSTVSLKARPSDGYRFAGWSDGCRFNPREIIATGGSYTFEAIFEPMGTDTVHYCPGNYAISGVGSTVGSTVWGIRLPSYDIPEGGTLTAVMLYVYSAGTYNLAVYTGTSHSTTAAIETVTFTTDDERMWQTIPLSTPVNTLSDVWITFSSDAAYPATFTYGGGTRDAFLWSSSLTRVGLEWNRSAMIKAIFEPTPQYTVSVNCIRLDGTAVDSSYVTGAGTYYEGETVVLQAAPRADTLRFEYWLTETGDTVYGDLYSFVINCDRAVTAVYGEAEGIEEFGERSSEFGVYPNPASDVVTVMAAEQGEAIVMDVMGRTVLKQQVTTGDNIVSVSTLPAGLYYVKVGTRCASFIVSR